MELRPYQHDCVEAIYAYLRTREGHPVAVLPTAAGKSVIIARLCHDTAQLWNGRVCVLSHVRELLEQTEEKLRRVDPSLQIGTYCAGLNRRDTLWPILLCQIQSVYRRACELGPFDLIIIDESHLVGESDEGMFRQFLADMQVINPQLRVIGMTATPFRMRSGLIYGADGDHLFTDVCFEIGVRELIVQGYLCPLRTKAGTLKPNTENLHVRGGEYIAGEVEALMDDDNLVASACREIVERTADRKSVLIFASGVRHGEHICRVMSERHGVECGFVCGETLPFERDSLLKRFRDGTLKYLCNVNVLTTGFDAPNIDCVALVRPTLSPGLYYQMVGRGFRLFPGKADCLVLDFGGNVLRHGPVDQLCISAAANGNGEAPAKECPQCHAIIAAGYANCPECGHAFPDRNKSKHDATASSEGILSDQATRTEHEVTEVFYSVHVKRGAPPDAPRSMRVDYRIGFNEYIPEWVCFEHTGYARQKAEQWWSRRSHEPVPETAQDATEQAYMGVLAPTLAITIERKPGDRFDRIVGYRLGDKPPRLDSEEDLPDTTAAYDENSVPF